MVSIPWGIVAVSLKRSRYSRSNTSLAGMSRNLASKETGIRAMPSVVATMIRMLSHRRQLAGTKLLLVHSITIPAWSIGNSLIKNGEIGVKQ